jgi:hypothetical protein
VRPGITDWASIWNPDEGSILAGAADPEAAYLELIRPTKVTLQLKYVREQSWDTDLKILWETMIVLVNPRAKLSAVRRLSAATGGTEGGRGPVSRETGRGKAYGQPATGA